MMFVFLEEIFRMCITKSNCFQTMRRQTGISKEEEFKHPISSIDFFPHVHALGDQNVKLIKNQPCQKWLQCFSQEVDWRRGSQLAGGGVSAM